MLLAKKIKFHARVQKCHFGKIEKFHAPKAPKNGLPTWRIFISLQSEHQMDLIKKPQIKD